MLFTLMLCFVILKVGEDLIIAKVRRLIPPELALVVFDGGEYSSQDSIDLFSRARMIIGVHGGALSNIIFSSVGCTVIELGFTTVRSRHYHQMSVALGLAYHIVHLVPTDLGLGANLVVLQITFASKITCRSDIAQI